MNTAELRHRRRVLRMARARRLQRRGVFLLPALFTVGNILCGFSSIILAGHGRFELAAALLILAGVLDGLDGRIARLTGSSSEFGVQLDSIADTVSFGVAPASIMYLWAVGPLGRLGWGVAFLYLICASSRLARFNIQHTVSDNRYFTGLPVPPAAAITMSLVLWHPDRVLDRASSVLVAVMMLVVALLMISTIRYRSFKDIGVQRRRSWLAIFPIAVGVTGFVLEPVGMLLFLSAVYVLSGPVGFLVGGRRPPAPAEHGTGAHEIDSSRNSGA